MYRALESLKFLSSLVSTQNSYHKVKARAAYVIQCQSECMYIKVRLFTHFTVKYTWLKSFNFPLYNHTVTMDFQTLVANTEHPTNICTINSRQFLP